MGGNDTSQFRIVERLEVLGGGQVAVSPVGPMESPVGDLLNDALDKSVLAPLG